VIAKLNADLRRVLALDETQKRLAGLGMVAAGGSPAEFDAYIKAEIAKWGKVIRDADIKAAE
jgi:tripartite-type tricarboxylate transporter receptor subunit TctC